jgi:uncharacterized SAM-binding protein YcdF (DUF218 family)
VKNQAVQNGHGRGRCKLRFTLLVRWFGGVALLLTLAMLAGYCWSPEILCIDSGDTRSGALVVLGGDFAGRSARACELYHRGAAPVVLASDQGEDMFNCLTNGGVPPQVIWRESESTSTKENALFCVAILRKAGLTNAIIVTSWYHSRRALNCFRKAAPEMTFYSRPTVADQPHSAWLNRRDRYYVRWEYAKLAYYWARWGVPAW